MAPANLADVESTNYGIAQSWNDLLTIGALWLYLSGLLYFATRLIVGALRLRAIAAQGQSLTENQTKTLEITARAIGLKTTPECLVCERTSVPLTFGITRPIIALPPSYLSWDTTTQQNCLLHEMAHIRRRDSGWRLVGLLACCVYWFHPLSHFVARRIRSTSEDATDDVVLQSGVSRSAICVHHPRRQCRRSNRFIRVRRRNGDRSVYRSAAQSHTAVRRSSIDAQHAIEAAAVARLCAARNPRCSADSAG